MIWHKLVKIKKIKKLQLMILLDPIYSEVRLKVKDFLKNWELLGKRAVVIY